MTVSPARNLGLSLILKADEARSEPPDCADEPIRIPGSIQRHGFLLLLGEHDKFVVAASRNVEEFFDVPLELILGASAETLLPRELKASLLASRPLESAGALTYLGSFQIAGRYYSVVTHRVSGELIVEFERQDRLVSPELTNQVITNFVNRLSKITDEQTLCDAITRQVRDLTGFNRILLYRFDEFGHGTVLSEENDGILPSYLDLRFPASDIPQQARDLYILNTTRVIPDASYTPSPLHGLHQREMGSLDLSMSLLRSVSPVHLEYMRNMGTLASMSISIVCEGRLWGLISAHNAQPCTVPYLVRSACDLLAKLVGTQLTSFRTGARLKQMVYFHAMQRRVLTNMLGRPDYLAAIAEQMHNLVSVAHADGVALVVDGQCHTAGETPDLDSILRLAAWMGSKPSGLIFETRHLAQHLPWAEEIQQTASGFMAIQISDVRQSYLMWFRPEIVTTAQWAGKPGKINETGTLNPRISFDTWKELLRGRSKTWTDTEIESAIEFRGAVTTLGLKRVEEAMQLEEARFLKLTQALPSLVWTADDDGQLTYVNQMWLDQGFSAHTLWYTQQPIAPEDQQRCAALWQAAVADSVPFECELHFQSAAGAPDRWNLVRAMPYLRADGSRAGWIGTCTDQTDLRQRELALRMTEKLALTGRMTSVIAHEINNPLEAIGNLLFLLAQRIDNDSESQTYIGMAESELLRISGITKQTLRWSTESIQKAEYGTAGALFDDVLRLYAGNIRNRQVKVTIEGGKDVRFYGRVAQLAQVLANLVANAIQAVPVGGSISVGAVGNGPITEIFVRDDGHGMNDETLRNLFQPFYTTKGDLGNGLGLYISHEIVERHHGRLTAKSQPGAGTEFRLYLPALAPAEESDTNPPR